MKERENKLHLRGLKKTVAISKNLDGLTITPSRSEKDLKGARNKTFEV
jgi:hypothetical protein